MIIQGRPMPKPAQAGESLIRLVIPACSGVQPDPRHAAKVAMDPGVRRGDDHAPLFAQMLVPISALGCVFSCGRCKHIHPAVCIVDEKPFALSVDLAEHLLQQRPTLQGKVYVITVLTHHEPQ